jgi:predicted nicotinamide N-methyase
VLTPGHPRIQRLKRKVAPTKHGHRVWGASFLLMDYLSRSDIAHGTRIMEVGCGWGLAGIHCARCHGARVTAVDRDPAVFPFLRLQARVNGVELDTMETRYELLTRRQLEDVDMLIGADICFWDLLEPPLKLLVSRALRAGVGTVLIADPGRPPFYRASERLIKKYGGVEIDWMVERPYKVTGYILRVGGGSHVEELERTDRLPAGLARRRKPGKGPRLPD